MPAADDGKVFNGLAQSIWNVHVDSPRSKRVLVSVSGIPGAGKSTLARKLADRLNTTYIGKAHLSTSTRRQSHADIANPTPHTFAVDVPMDGFHLTRAQLRAMPNPDEATHRRGAAFTYDAAGYCELVDQLAKRIDASKATIYAPAFDHATKDPVANAIAINNDTHIIILEGNYINLDQEPWSSAARSFDIKIIAAVDRAVARERLVKRHVVSGICADEAGARYRVESTDDLNAEEVLRYQVPGVMSVDLLET